MHRFRAMLIVCFVIHFFSDILAMPLEQGQIPADTAKARQLLQEAITLNTDRSFHEAIKKLEQSKDLLNKSRAKRTLMLVEVWVQTGRSYRGLKQYPKAISADSTAIRAGLKLRGKKSMLVAKLYSNLGQDYHDYENYQLSKTYHEKALAIRQSKASASAIYISQSLNAIGDIHRHLKEYEEALNYHQKALNLLAPLPSNKEGDLAMAQTHYNLGLLYADQRQYKKALEYYRLALQKRIAIYGENHLDVALIHHDMAISLERDQNYTEAIFHTKKALEIRSEILADDNIDIAWGYFNLGVSYGRLKAYDQAIENYQKALAIRKKLFPHGHSQIGWALTNLAFVYQNKKDFENAIQTHLQAVEVREVAHGPQSLEVANNFHGLGYSYSLINDRENAVKYYEKAKDIRAERLDTNNLDLAWTYNNLAYNYYYLGALRKAVEPAKKALKIRKAALGDYHTNVFYSNNILGIIYNNLGQYNNALDHYFYGIQIAEKTYGKESEEMAIIQNNMGAVYTNIGHYDKAIYHYNIALHLIEKTKGSHHPSVAACYNNIGILFSEKEDYQQSLAYHKKALEIRQLTLSENNPDIAYSYNNLGNTYNILEDYKTALYYLDKAVTILEEQASTPGSDLIESYVNQAEILVNLEKFEEAFILLEKTKNLIKSTDSERLPNSVSFYQIQSLVFFKTKQPELAIEALNKALQIQLEISGPNHPITSKIYYKYAEIFLSKKNYTEALNYLDKSINAIRLDNNNTSDFSSGFSLKEYNQNLTSKGIIFRKLSFKENHIKNLHQSRTLFLSGIKGVNQRIKTISPASKADVAKENFGLFEEAILTNQHLFRITDSIFYLNESFQYTERSKSLLLYQSMQESNALHFAGIPDSLLEQEYNLRVDITYHDKKRQEKLMEGLSETDTTVLTISSKLFDLNQVYDSLKATFEEEYPEYYKLKYDLSPISIQEIQADLLSKNQAILEYFVGDTSIFAFIITKDDFLAKEIKRDFPLEEWVKELMYNISQPHAYTLESYAKAAFALYDKLIASLGVTLPKQLIIIPDGILGYIPFEALLTKQPNNVYAAESLPYLLHQKQISYAYSATLLREMQHKKHLKTTSREVLALAPFAEVDTILTSHLNQSDWMASLQRDTLTNLPGSRIELDSLKKIFPTDALYGEEATKAAFTSIAGDYQIIHLSTHGKADSRSGDYSYLAFYPLPDSTENELLYVRDLYNLQFNADLVVLSACETGTGELQRGEGIISLARAFAYAGAKSIATTLWKVNDQSTQKLMVLFYQYLEKGFAKDQALRQAKLDFLKNNTGLQAAPYFWSAVISIGDMTPIK